MILIDDKTPEETFNRIIKKFESVNYQPGFTLPYDIAPWYVVITELRLLTLSPLIACVQYGIEKEKIIIKHLAHNIIKQEFAVIQKKILLERLFPLPLNKTEADNFIIKPVVDQKIFKITYGTEENGTFNSEFWGDLLDKDLIINSNLKMINRAIVFYFLDKKWSIWIFGNADDFVLGKVKQNSEKIEIKLPSNLPEEQFKNEGLNGLNILSKRIFF